MANQTDPFADSIHGTNPQNLIEKITRIKIYNSNYWKQHCFGLTAETIVDKAVALKYCGGVYAGNIKPTPFLCLCLKLLQLQPEKEIILEFIQNEDVSISFHPSLPLPPLPSLPYPLLFLAIVQIFKSIRCILFSNDRESYRDL